MADVLERDAGFCSGVDDDDIEAEDGIHSPTDASEDSVDVKVQAISFRNRNKRKCAEPRKLDSELPAKKRKIKSDVDVSGRSPFRPWSASPPPEHRRCEPRTNLPMRCFEPSGNKSNGFDVSSVATLTSHYLPSGCQFPVQRLSSAGSFLSALHQEEPLSLVSKRKVEERSEGEKLGKGSSPPRLSTGGAKGEILQDVRIPVTSPTWYPLPKDVSQVSQSPAEGRTNETGSYLTNKVKLTVSEKTNSEKKCKAESKTKGEEISGQSDNKFRIDSLLSCGKAEGSSGAASTSKSSQGGQQRNYKNMTRERRIEANARERTRVHTISAAFDTLRHSIPAYSHNQKLSKLSVLRIACSYIMTLSRLAGHDYSKDQSEPDLSSCVDNVSKTIQTEGKIRKKRED